MTNEEILERIHIRLKRYKEQYASLEMNRDDLNRYKSELFEKVEDISDYVVKRRDINNKIINTSILFMFANAMLAGVAQRYQMNNQVLEMIFSNPKVYCAIVFAFALPLSFSTRIADNIMVRKYGKEINKILEKNQEKEEEIDSVNISLNFVQEDLKYASEEIKKLENTINVLNEVEDDNFTKISQPRIKQLIK